MKKKYLLLSAMIAGSSVLFAQNINPKNIGNPESILEKSDYTPKLELQNNKAYGDTIYHETFDTNLNGWTVGHNTADPFDWKWDYKAPGGDHTTEPALSSTSGPGFISLPMDGYNSPGGTVEMDAWITSPAIPINPVLGSVVLHFEHYQRYCCRASSVAPTSTYKMVVQISTDGTNFDTFDGTHGRGANSMSPNGETIEINLTEQLAYADTCYIRFRVLGMQAYFWMIDDVTLLEGPDNAMELENYEIIYHPNTYEIFPNYRSVPQSQVSPIVHRAMTFNAGSNTQTNVKVTADVYHDSTLTGGFGDGYVYSETALVDLAVLGAHRDTTLIDARKFLVMKPGYYSQHITVSSDSLNQYPMSQRTASSTVRITDSIFGVDAGVFRGSTGPKDYVDGKTDGSQMVQLYNLTESALATSVSYYMPNVSGKVAKEIQGVEIKPHIYPFEERGIMYAINNRTNVRDSIAAAIGTSIASTAYIITLDTMNAGTWVTIPLVPTATLAKGQYLVGFEQMSGFTSSQYMAFGRDQASEGEMEGFACYIYVNGGSNPGWYTADRVPGFHLNLGNSPITTIGDNETVNNVEFAVAPNPNSGEFTLMVRSQEPLNYTMNVSNMLGQVVYTEEISVNGTLNKQMKLSQLDKGIYFVSLENGTEKLVKKIVLK